MPDSDQELSLESGNKKLKLRGSDLLTSVIGMVMCSGLAVFGFALYEHKTDARDATSAMVSAVKDMTASHREAVVAQRVMNCLLATEQKDRRRQLETCERLAR